MLGSIGTVVETSDLQREAFNAAFAEAGLDWHWGPADYAAMLAQAGGERRIADYASLRDEAVDAAGLHAAKTRHFHAALRERPPRVRDGIGDLLHLVRQASLPLALVTSTDAATVQRVIESTGGLLGRDQFAFIGHRDMVEQGKPDPAIYQLALAQLGLRPEQAVAIEDNPDGLRAAFAARIPCIAFPGQYHADADFSAAAMVTYSVAPSAIGLKLS